jgi:hypothetical protein
MAMPNWSTMIGYGSQPSGPTPVQQGGDTAGAGDPDQNLKWWQRLLAFGAGMTQLQHPEDAAKVTGQVESGFQR